MGRRENRSGKGKDWEGDQGRERWKGTMEYKWYGSKVAIWRGNKGSETEG